MGKDISHNVAVARETFDEAEKAFGGGLIQLCFEGPEDELKKTENTQPAIVATSIAMLRALTAFGIKPDLVAGHSVGEYAALVAAESLSLSDAIRLTRLRGKLMETSCPDGIGGMAAVMGFEPEEVQKVLDDVSGEGIAQIAAINTTGQVVIAGHIRALTQVVAKAKAAGAMNATILPVSGPFHSALMQNARDGLEHAITEANLREARVPVVANVDAQRHTDPATFKALLLEQLTRPVLWQASVETMVRDGVSVFVELGAGRVLSGLIRKFNRSLTCLSVRDAETLSKTVDWFRASEYPVVQPAG